VWVWGLEDEECIVVDEGACGDEGKLSVDILNVSWVHEVASHQVWADKLRMRLEFIRRSDAVGGERLVNSFT
jgi:hypothetical protein